MVKGCTGSGTRCCGPIGGAEARLKLKSRFKFLVSAKPATFWMQGIQLTTEQPCPQHSCFMHVLAISELHGRPLVDHDK